MHGAGELSEVHQIFQSLPGLVSSDSFTGDALEATKALTPDESRAAAKRYLDRLNTLAPATACRVVDKMPDNIRLVGLIALLWPNAHVILCMRDLRDIAVSCRQTDFKTMRWTNNWDHIAQRFGDFHRIVNHWRQTRPIPWFEIRYEDLVADLEGHARGLIQFVGLEWNPACLEFHSTRRLVRTASLFRCASRSIHVRSDDGETIRRC